MKKIFLTILIAISLFSTYAQIPSLSMSGLRFGPALNFYKDQEIEFSYSVGLQHGRYFANRFKYEVLADYAPYYNTVYSSDLSIFKTNNRFNYLRFAAPIGYWTGSRDATGTTLVCMGIGPYYSILPSVKSTTIMMNDQKVKNDLKIGTDPTDDTKPYDYGICMNFSLGFGLFMFGVEYYHGLNDLSPRDNKIVKSRSVTGTLAINLIRLRRGF